MAKKEDKQFPLINKHNCAIYLNRIISSCERCMDRLKEYNEEGKTILLHYKGKQTIPIKIYTELLDKSSNNINYLLNLLGDAQSSSISYFKFRTHLSKHPLQDVTLNPLESEIQELLADFNKMRNWQNHVPESLLVAEMEQVNEGKMIFPMDPVDILMHTCVTYLYFQNMVDTNICFYHSARKIIQAAKRDYKNIYEKSVRYNRIYTDQPLDSDKSIPTQKSAKIQGIKSNIGLSNNTNFNCDKVG